MVSFGPFNPDLREYCSNVRIADVPDATKKENAKNGVEDESMDVDIS